VSVFILDTDTLSLIQHNNAIVLAAVAAAQSGGDTVGITAVTVEEQINGWFRAFRAAKNHTQLAQASQLFSLAVPLWASFPIYPLTEQALARFDGLVARKLNVGKMDLRIASIALEPGATIVTHNLRDFGRIPGLPVVDWTVPPPPPAVPPTGGP
jgi:tRNA(fMet)-specific endonuclease VapC